MGDWCIYKYGFNMQWVLVHGQTYQPTLALTPKDRKIYV